MWPTVFGLPARPLFIVVGAGIAIVGAVYRARSLGHAPAHLWLLFVGFVLVGLLGAKIDSLIERGSWLAIQPLSWELQQGFRYPGGMAGVLVVLLLLAAVRRIRPLLLELGDLTAPAAAMAMGIVRIGCFLAGCCHGSVSQLPWAVSFPSGSFAWSTQVATRLIRADAEWALPVHPLQLYFAIWSVGLAVYLLRMNRRRAYAGQVLLLYIAADNLMKFLLEYLRDPHVPHLQWASLAIGALAGGVLAIGYLRGWRTVSFVKAVPAQPASRRKRALCRSARPFETASR